MRRVMDSTGPRSSRQQRRAAARRRAKSSATPTQPALATVFTVNTNADGAPVADANLTLREAVEQANTAVGPDIIQFAPALSGQTITLDNTQGQIKIKDSVDIQGLG